MSSAKNPTEKHTKIWKQGLLLRIVGVLVACLAGLTGPAESAAVNKTIESIAISAGRFNYARHNPETELGVELRFSPRRWRLAPMIGLVGTDNGAGYLYGGLRRELPLDLKWSVTPSFAVSLYDAGDGHDLGGPIEFRSALEISYLIGRRSRAGLAIYHLSNASIYKRNPGSNSVVLTLSLPLSHR